MGFSLVLATLLCFSTWMTSVHATHGPVTNCCIMWSKTRVKVEKIMNYTIQPEGICPITAIVFLTNRGNRICSDPNTDWAKRTRNKLDKETKDLQGKGQNEEGSTSDTMTPAVSTAPVKAPQKKGRNGSGRRRWQRRRCRKGSRR